MVFQSLPPQHCLKPWRKPYRWSIYGILLYLQYLSIVISPSAPRPLCSQHSQRPAGPRQRGPTVAAAAATELGVPLSVPLSPHEIMCLEREFLRLWFWACAPFSECHISRVVLLARSASNLREAHLAWYLKGYFHLSGRAQMLHTLCNKGKTGRN